METQDQSEKNEQEKKADQQVLFSVIDRMKTGFRTITSPAEYL